MDRRSETYIPPNNFVVRGYIVGTRLGNQTTSPVSSLRLAKYIEDKVALNWGSKQAAQFVAWQNTEVG